MKTNIRLSFLHYKQMHLTVKCARFVWKKKLQNVKNVKYYWFKKQKKRQVYCCLRKLQAEMSC